MDNMRKKRWFRLGFVGWICTTVIPVGIVVYGSNFTFTKHIQSSTEFQNQGYKLIKN